MHNAERLRLILKSYFSRLPCPYPISFRPGMHWHPARATADYGDRVLKSDWTVLARIQRPADDVNSHSRMPSLVVRFAGATPSGME